MLKGICLPLLFARIIVIIMMRCDKMFARKFQLITITAVKPENKRNFLSKKRHFLKIVKEQEKEK